MFYKLLNTYTRQWSFPHRGLKYFLRVAKWLGLENRVYKKKIADNLFMYVSPAEHIQQQLFWYGCYEKEVGELIKLLLRPADVFLDIGANIGYFSLLAAHRQSSATIFSFEPVGMVFERLKGNISLNKVENVRAINAGVGEMNEIKKIYISGDDNTGMSSFYKPENYSGSYEQVQVITIDEWFKSCGETRIDLVKIDIEGSEFAALKGMNAVLQQFKPAVIVEMNPSLLFQFDTTPSDILDHFNTLSFDSYLIGRSQGLTRINSYETSATNNVLFIHEERSEFYQSLIL